MSDLAVHTVTETEAASVVLKIIKASEMVSANAMS